MEEKPAAPCLLTELADDDLAGDVGQLVVGHGGHDGVDVCPQLLRGDLRQQESGGEKSQSMLRAIVLLFPACIFYIVYMQNEEHVCWLWR